MYRRPPPPPLTDVSLPIFSEGRGASVLRLVCSLPLARVEGVEKGRVREEGEKAGGLGTSPLLSSSMAWGGGLVCEQALYGRTELLRELARRLSGESLGTGLITGTYPLVGKMNSREEGFKNAFVEGMDYESATQSNWKTKEGGAINLSLVWLPWNRLKIKRYEVYW